MDPSRRSGNFFVHVCRDPQSHVGHLPKEDAPPSAETKREGRSGERPSSFRVHGAPSVNAMIVESSGGEFEYASATSTRQRNSWPMAAACSVADHVQEGAAVNPKPH